MICKVNIKYKNSSWQTVKQMVNLSDKSDKVIREYDFDLKSSNVINIPFGGRKYGSESCF